METIVRPGVGEIVNLEREVNEFFFAKLVDDRVAVSAKLQVHVCSRLRQPELIA